MARFSKRQREDEAQDGPRKKAEIVSVDHGNAGEDVEDESDVSFDDSDDGSEDGSDREAAMTLKNMGRKELLLRAMAAEDDDEDEEEEDDQEDDEEVDELEGGSDTELVEEEDDAQQVASQQQTGPRKNKQRVLLLSSRGITHRYRHLLNDLGALMPHSKKDAKLDSKHNLTVLNELAELSNCNNCVYFEVRKHTDLYMWMAKTPNGPSVKFHVHNVHTMDELRMTGNCLKGSRPILSFDQNFDEQPHYQLLKEMFTQAFGTPPTARKIKPFVDHILSFSIADNKVWFRNYQIVEKPLEKGQKEKDISLVEIGPRFVLSIMRIFDGSFGGSTLFANSEFVSPNEVRRQRKIEMSQEYRRRMQNAQKRIEKKKETRLPADPLADVFQ